tara:strand:- start:170 stop:763 length:594 start_codon:yes stop_codon:yes gene_type:complete
MPYKNKEDQAKASKLWYEKNKEKTIARTKQWKIDNAEKEKEQSKKRYDKINPETGKKIGAEKRQYYKKLNPHKTKETARRYRYNKKLNHFNDLIQLYIKNTTDLEFNKLITENDFFELKILKSTVYVIYKNNFCQEKYLKSLNELEQWLQIHFTESKRKSSVKIVSLKKFKRLETIYNDDDNCPISHVPSDLVFGTL